MRLESLFIKNVNNQLLTIFISIEREHCIALRWLNITLGIYYEIGSKILKRNGTPEQMASGVDFSLKEKGLSQFRLVFAPIALSTFTKIK
jgi:hypothetical protein